MTVRINKNNPIGDIVWDESTKHIIFESEFNQSLAGVIWPKLLESVTFNWMFRHPILNVCKWPNGVQIILFYEMIKHDTLILDSVTTNHNGHNVYTYTYRAHQVGTFTKRAVHRD